MHVHVYVHGYDGKYQTSVDKQHYKLFAILHDVFLRDVVNLYYDYVLLSKFELFQFFY